MEMSKFHYLDIYIMTTIKVYLLLAAQSQLYLKVFFNLQLVK